MSEFNFVQLLVCPISFAGFKEWEHLAPWLEIGSETLPLQLFYSSELMGQSLGDKAMCLTPHLIDPQHH